MIRGGAIGDFVLTLPVLAALRSRFPAARIEVLGYPKIARIALVGGMVDDVRSIEARALAGFFARDGDLDPGLGEFFASCQIIISYLFDTDGIFQANVARCSAAQFIQGPHRPDEARNIPASEVMLKPLERLAIYGAEPVPRRVNGPAGTVSVPAAEVKAKLEKTASNVVPSCAANAYRPNLVMSKLTVAVFATTQAEVASFQ